MKECITHVCFERVWLVPESFEVLEWVGGAIFASRLAKALQGWQSAQGQGLWPYVVFSLRAMRTNTFASTHPRTHTHAGAHTHTHSRATHPQTRTHARA